ncbi:MAG: peptidase M28, partial [Acidobacteriota bacterium]
TGTTPTLVLTLPRGRRTLRHGGEVAISGAVGGGAVSLNAPLVFAGYGMDDKALGYDDYQGLDVCGKIAVVLWGSPLGMDSEVGAYLQSEQRRVAAAHGAVALIGIPTRASAKAFPWQSLTARAARPQTAWLQRDGTPFDSGDGLQASLFIAPRAAASLFDGAASTLDQILDAADRPGGRPRGLPLAVRAANRVSTTARRFSSPEVIGVVEGADPVLKHEFVALMAHADHLGVNSRGTGDRINNGTMPPASPPCSRWRARS